MSKDSDKKVTEQSRADKILGGTALSSLGISGLKTTLDRGHITGRETMYHGTATKNVSSILESGLDASRASDPNNLTNTILKDLDSDAVKNKVYFSRRKTIAKSVNARASSVFTGTPDADRAMLKASVPSWKLKEVDNPELKGAKNSKEFGKILRSRMGFNDGVTYDASPKPIKAVVDKFNYDLYSKKNTATFEGSIGPEVFKDSKHYSKLTASEVKDYIKNNPKRFVIKGLAPAALFASVTGIGASNLYSGIKNDKVNNELQLTEKQATIKLGGNNMYRELLDEFEKLANLHTKEELDAISAEAIPAVLEEAKKDYKTKFIADRVVPQLIASIPASVAASVVHAAAGGATAAALMKGKPTLAAGLTGATLAAYPVVNFGTHIGINRHRVNELHKEEFGVEADRKIKNKVLLNSLIPLVATPEAVIKAEKRKSLTND